MQYIINQKGEIVTTDRSLAEAGKFVFKGEKGYEVIGEEEKVYRTINWCTENGFEYYDVLEDEDGNEFCFELMEDSPLAKKNYITYLPVEPTLQDINKQY